MDVSGYLPMFLAEAREHLQELNLAVVRIERQPDDHETLDEIFRIAHSFKGMSATMGFARVAALTHEMEDVFELLRRRRAGVERDAVDTLLACLDALSAAVDSIESVGEERLDEAPLVERLRGLVREGARAEPPAPADGSPDVDAAAAAGGRRVLHVVVELAPEVLMPSVRAYMVLAALGEHGELLASSPREESIELFDGRVIQAWVASEHEESALQRTLGGVMDVASASVVEFTPGGEQAPGRADVVEIPLLDSRVAEDPAQATVRKTSTVRVDAERLDQLMHLMGELVVHRTAVESLISGVQVEGLGQAMQDLTRSSQALQAMVMQVRMIPVEAVFLRFPRLVRDLAAKLGKRVELKLAGQDTELDRTVVDALGDPLVHLVRNALDHGLEQPHERAAAGKHEVGVIEIAARHAGGNVLISVSDDGRGVDPARIARHAAARGLISTDAVGEVDEHRALELVFAPGFSTAGEPSDVSGRGVGMDAVRAAINSLGGEVEMQSEHGVGTTTQIRLPLTLAIMASLVVEANGLPFAIPLDRVERTIRLADHTVRSVAGQRALVLRDGVLPLLDLAESFGYAHTLQAEHAVIVRGSDRRLAVSVAGLVGQRELVTRPLPSALAKRAALSGGAVLANGEIALIVDTDALALSGSDRAHVATAA